MTCYPHYEPVCHVAKGTSIHLSPQMEWYSVKVDDKSVKVGCIALLHLMVLLFP